MITLKSIADKLDHAGADISAFFEYLIDVSDDDLEALNSYLDQLLENQKRRGTHGI